MKTKTIVVFLMAVLVGVVVTLILIPEKPQEKAVKMTITQYCWPKVFTNSDFEYDSNDPNIKQIAQADGLTGWGNCMAGAKIPNEFGHGMTKIGTILKISATPENLMKD